MRFRVLQRRAATAVGIYGSALLGILATIVAAREMTVVEFSRFALVFAITGLLQLFLDLTANEVVVKYGNRYAARGDWGRFRRLFDIGLRVKLIGGVLGAVGVVIAALVSPWIWNVPGLTEPLLIAAFVPLLQAPEGMTEAALLVHNRYDLRAGLLVWSMALRLAAVAVAASHGVVPTFAAIVVAQVLATSTALAVGLAAFRRWPRADSQPLGEDAPAIRNFAIQSTVASGLTSLRTLLPTVLVGIVAKPQEVGHFRIAQAPQTAYASLSAPARLVLLAEQTYDFEHGRADRAWRLLKRYIGTTSALALVSVPVLWLLMPWLVRVIYGVRYEAATTPARLMLIVAAIQLVFGWSKSFPVSIGRPGLRTAGQLIELTVLVPLVLLLGHYYGASGAVVALIVSSSTLACFWLFGLARLRSTPVGAPREAAT
jgi:O-antigen/teichoic acid export membrane protein